MKIMKSFWQSAIFLGPWFVDFIRQFSFFNWPVSLFELVLMLTNCRLALRSRLKGKWWAGCFVIIDWRPIFMISQSIHHRFYNSASSKSFYWIAYCEMWIVLMNYPLGLAWKVLNEKFWNWSKVFYYNICHMTMTQYHQAFIRHDNLI